MKTLSTRKLAEIVTSLREKKKLTKEALGKLTGINRIMIGRIENEEFTPSIVQLEKLADVLGFEVTDIFIEKETANSFIALRSDTLCEKEKEGVDVLLKMMLTLRQQIRLRSKYEEESISKIK